MKQKNSSSNFVVSCIVWAAHSVSNTCNTLLFLFVCIFYIKWWHTLTNWMQNISLANLINIESLLYCWCARRNCCYCCCASSNKHTFSFPYKQFNGAVRNTISNATMIVRWNFRLSRLFCMCYYNNNSSIRLYWTILQNNAKPNKCTKPNETRFGLYHVQ